MNELTQYRRNIQPTQKEHIFDKQLFTSKLEFKFCSQFNSKSFKISASNRKYCLQF